MRWSDSGKWRGDTDGWEGVKEERERERKNKREIGREGERG